MNEGIKKLENEAEEMQKHLDKLKAKIADMKKSELPVIEAGKFYKSIYGPIVFATEKRAIDNDVFAGIAINRNCESGCCESNCWDKECFTKEVKPTWEEV